MTRFAFILAAWFTCLALYAQQPAVQEPRVPTTELEGVWQEPTLPGETPGLRYRITFVGDEVTIEFSGGVIRGTFRLDAEAVPATIRIDIELPGDARLALSGIYRKDEDQLALQIAQVEKPRVRFADPPFKVEPMEPRWRNALELAPLTLTLAKANASSREDAILR